MSIKANRTFNKVVSKVKHNLLEKIKDLQNKYTKKLISKIIDTSVSSMKIVLFDSPQNLKLSKIINFYEANTYITKASIAILSYSYYTNLPKPGFKTLFQRAWEIILEDFNNVMNTNVTREVMSKYETTMKRGLNQLSMQDSIFSKIYPDEIYNETTAFNVIYDTLKDNFTIGSEIATVVWGIKIPYNIKRNFLNYINNIKITDNIEHNFSNYIDNNIEDNPDLSDLCIQQAIYIGNTIFHTYGKQLASSVPKILNKIIRNE